MLTKLALACLASLMLFGSTSALADEDTPVALRTTSLTLSCSLNSVVIGVYSDCTASVTDNDAGSPIEPTGTVVFGTDSSGGGYAGTNACTLSSGSCSLQYDAFALGTGTHTLNAIYVGDDGAHWSSQDFFTIMVSKRASSTAVECDPTTITLGETTTCSAAVTNISPGLDYYPVGTIDFGDGITCTLVLKICSSEITPTSAGTKTITGVYDGDVRYIGSSGFDEVVVSVPDPTGPTGEPTGPTGEPTGPTGEPTGPTGEPTGPTGEPTGPTGEPTGPTGEPTGPTGEPTGPTGATPPVTDPPKTIPPLTPAPIAPNTTLTGKPAKKATKKKATFTFTSDQPGATFICKLDQKPAAACTSPKSLKRLGAGKHKFTVYAVSGIFPDATPEVFSWRVVKPRH